MNRLFITSAAIVSALAAMLVACSTDSTVPDIGRMPKTLTVKQEDAASSNSTPARSMITDQGEKGLNAIWKEGDVMSVYNRTYPSTAGFECITALSTSKNTAFIGKVGQDGFGLQATNCGYFILPLRSPALLQPLVMEISLWIFLNRKEHLKIFSHTMTLTTAVQ